MSLPSRRMKLHLNLIHGVTNSLSEIFLENRYADKVLERVLKTNKRWGARDRAFIAENTYDMVRYWRLLLAVSGLEGKELNQNNLYTLFGTWQLLKGNDLPRWDEFRNVDPEQVRKQFGILRTQRKYAQSLPDWLDELGLKELGKRWNAEAEAMNQQAPVVLRVNLLKTTKAELAETFKLQGIKTKPVEGCKDALMLDERQNIFLTDAFKEGLFEVQDAASQLVAEFLDLKPGMRIVDACAGAGGKTLHIASLCGNKGRILALDTEQWKLDEAKKRARRAGASNLETRLIEGQKTLKKLFNTADRLLLDVPCSGTGVIRRNPDAKWKLSPEFLDRVRAQQAEILDKYAHLTKPGGKMVYATCSIMPSENSIQVKSFLAAHPEFELEEERAVFPSETGFDGFYMARMVRKETSA